MFFKTLKINNFLKIFKKLYSNDKNTFETDVCIIGGGSIGMTLSSLLNKYEVDHIILEKEKDLANLFNHPRAHYISPRTVEILKYAFEGNGFSDTDKNIFSSEESENIAKVENWRHYRYCEYLLEKNSYYGEIDHFSVKSKNSEDCQNSNINYMNYIQNLANSYPMNIGQNKLNKLLYKNISSSKYYTDQAVQNFEFQENEKKYLIKCQNSTFKAKILVGCDGSHSQIRKLLNFKNQGRKNIQNFVNAHFFSKDLANRLRKIGKSSMLHFIFNPYYVCVLISYDMDKGEFVLQIPYFKKVEHESDFDKSYCLNILRQLISQNGSFSDSVDIVILLF